MGCKTTKTNFRVEVYVQYVHFPSTAINYTDQQRINDCKVMLGQIIRHVDDVDNHASGIVWDTEKRCEFCGSDWTETTPHNGGCCQKDIEVMDEYTLGLLKDRTCS
jgi:hypothetical protein